MNHTKEMWVDDILETPTEQTAEPAVESEVPVPEAPAPEVTAPTHEIKCLICGVVEKDFLGDHLLEVHGITAAGYVKTYPGAQTISPRLFARYNREHPAPKRKHPPKPEELRVTFCDQMFKVNVGVPPESCLPMPEHYRIPAHGELHEDVEHATTSLYHGRSIYIWGLPGSGKDALFHAWSAMTRTPAIIRQAKPGTDIEAWFFSRGFNDTGTYWEEGNVLKALRDGYVTPQGVVVPYLLLVSDFDRADREQAEHLRLITDSIQGRVDGPAGITYRVLPGTRVVATANTAGSGDDRGRMISANPIDASLLDRFDRKFQFHWMDWVDEEAIVRAKFPILGQRCPKIFDQVGRITVALRKAILGGDLYAEFSHRGVCSILGHAQDILVCDPKGKVPTKLLRLAARAWLDGLPDQENRDAAIKIISPHVSMLAGEERETRAGSLVEGF